MTKRWLVGSMLASAVAIAPMTAGAQITVTLQGQAIFAPAQPPRAVLEARPATPGPGYRWIAGSWNWNGSQYVWAAGRWEATPTGATSYSIPRWSRTPRGYQFQPGRWIGRRGVTVDAPTAVAQPPAASVVVLPTVAVDTGLAPPPVINELQPASPGAGFAWVAGTWVWSGRQYQWAAGHWVQPPQTHQTYVAGEWRSQGGRYHYEPGRWREDERRDERGHDRDREHARDGRRDQEQGRVEIVTTVAPPPAVVETQPATPGAGYTWVAGYWTWNGSQHAWTPGHYEQPPANAQNYVAPRWEQSDRGFRFRQGRWLDRRGSELPAQPPVVVPVVMAPVANAPTGLGYATVVPPNPPPLALLVPTAPPPAVVESPGRPPAAAFTWVPGYWNWNGSTHAWTGGHWERPPTGAQNYAPGQWQREGAGYRFHAGRWVDPRGTVIVQPPR